MCSPRSHQVSLSRIVSCLPNAWGMPLRLLGMLWLVLGLGACGEGRPLAAARPGRVCEGQSALYLVSHQDDDLLFMNPDILRDIRAGKRVRTVYLTAGDAGADTHYWLEREEGIRAAYAEMAGEENTWSADTELVEGKRLRTQRLRGESQVSVVFLRLPDGYLHGEGFAATGHSSLEKLWKEELPRLASVDGNNQYTRAELIAVLNELMTRAEADCIGTLDSGGLYGGDHSDHRHSAKFAFEAHRGYSRPHRFSQYRGYNIRDEPVNLSAETRDEKWEVLSAYARHDTRLCHFGGTDCLPHSHYAQWVWRQYGVTALHDLGGSLSGPSGRCLDARDDAPSPGAPAQVRDCMDGARQRWTLLKSGQLRGASGQCLEVPEGNRASATDVRLSECADVPRQKWTLLANGQLQGPAGRCLEVRDGTSAEGAPVQLGDCVDAPRQKWVPRFGRVMTWSPAVAVSEVSGFHLADVNGDGHADACVRGAEGLSCALNTSPGTFSEPHLFLTGFTEVLDPLQFADLNHDGRADVCGLAPEGLRCALANEDGTAFVEARAWTSDALRQSANDADASTLRLADVDGDGYADVCLRASEGVRCALNDKGGHFAPFSVWLGTADAESLLGAWPATGAMMQLGDIDHDGRADLCGRASDGIRCALAQPAGTGFGDLHPWSYRNEFSDEAGWGKTAGDVGSLRLADVNGDGFADLCGRQPRGLVCSLSNGGRFQQMHLVKPGGYADTQGWGANARGSTLRFQDLNGDGHADVCGWDGARVVCALAP